MTKSGLRNGRASFKARLPVKSLGVRFVCPRNGMANCHHSLDLSRTVDDISFGSNNIGCGHRCFTAGPSGILMLHLATSGRGSVAVGVKLSLVHRTSLSMRSGRLMFAKGMSFPLRNPNKIYFRKEVTILTSGKRMGVRRSKMNVGRTSTIALVISIHASCGDPSCGGLYTSNIGGTVTGSCSRLGRTRVGSCGALCGHISVRFKRSTGHTLPASIH